MQYDVLVFIGRFQPFHLGHKAVVDTALENAKKVLIVLGSHDQPRTARNPFTTQERIAFITAVYPDLVKAGRIVFAPQVDHTYNLDRWIAGIQASAHMAANNPFTPDPVKIGLIGHNKDHTSFYLKAFPTWGCVEAMNYDNIDATKIRSRYFGMSDRVDEMVPEPVLGFLENWFNKQDFYDIRQEHVFIDKYKEQWKDAPYPPTFFTSDSVVVQSGHVLLVERKAAPGKGLWALPGGFIGQHELAFDAAIRELREETRISVPEPVLRGSFVKEQRFEDPHRSLRGRTITIAHHFELKRERTLPKVKGSDDARKAWWEPLGNLDRKKFFEDHYDIIETMVGI